MELLISSNLCQLLLVDYGHSIRNFFYDQLGKVLIFIGILLRELVFGDGTVDRVNARNEQKNNIFEIFVIHAHSDNVGAVYGFDFIRSLLDIYVVHGLLILLQVTENEI